jgi:hypothetical protein
MMILPSQAFIIKTCWHKIFIAPGDVRASLEDEGDTAREPMFQGSLAKHCPWSGLMSNA